MYVDSWENKTVSCTCKQRLKISLNVPIKKLCSPHSVSELNSSLGLKEKNGQGKKLT